MQFISETEALRFVFPKDIRPSLKAWQRYRRELNLPHYVFGKRIVYEMDELEQAIKKLKRPVPEA